MSLDAWNGAAFEMQNQFNGLGDVGNGGSRCAKVIFSIKAALVPVEVSYSYIIYGCELKKYRVWLLVDLFFFQWRIESVTRPNCT